MNSKDPRGYYKILAINLNATASEIKAAFKKRAMELHPDRNTSKDTTEQFQLLNEAFSVLSDSDSRAQYDTILVDAPHHSPDAKKAPPEFIVCSACNKVTAQPRYAIFYDVRSYIVGTTKTGHQGIFCSACAEKKALKASAITWMFGWWGLPWGLLYSIQALFINMFGGKRPTDINARLTFYQAWVFSYHKKYDIAYAVAQDALKFARKIRPDNFADKLRASMGKEVDHEGETLKTEIEQFIDFLKMNGGRPLGFVDVWGLFNRPFYVQASVMFGVLGAFIIATYDGSSSSYSPTPSQYTYKTPPSEVEPLLPTVPNIQTVALKPAYVRPSVDPNGNPWPLKADYLGDFPLLRTQGLSEVTVDNTSNDSDVFVKLVAIKGGEAMPVRVFFIPAHGKFTLEDVTAGKYDIRYRDLDSGGLSRSEAFEAKEITTETGTQYSVLTMTLYKVANGNMQTYDLADAEF